MKISEYFYNDVACKFSFSFWGDDADHHEQSRQRDEMSSGQFGLKMEEYKQQSKFRVIN